MLFISGWLLSGGGAVCQFCFNLAIEMLFISGNDAAYPMSDIFIVSISQSRCFSYQGDRYHCEPCSYRVSISQSRCFSYQDNGIHPTGYRSHVSISQSRCFSYQVSCKNTPAGFGCTIVSISQSRCFSYQVKSESAAIENRGAGEFQSRNRDAFHISRRFTNATSARLVSSFNLAIEMLFISGKVLINVRNCFHVVSISQSRCFSFQGLCSGGVSIGDAVSISQSRCFSFQDHASTETEDTMHHVSISQSRCFSFQAKNRTQSQAINKRGFNLAIEMLFISGRNRRRAGAGGKHVVSISQSRCFSFQGQCFVGSGNCERFRVSISQSRCFSFQVCSMTHGTSCLKVSISQSRCFSFQDTVARGPKVWVFCSFNLAIEMLFISGMRATRHDFRQH